MRKPMGVTIRSLLLLALLSSSAAAAWPPAGKAVMKPGSPYGIGRVWLLDHPSGDLLVDALANNSTSYGPGVLRLQQNGEIAPGWPATGAGFLSALRGFAPPALQGLAMDALGTLWHSTYTSSAVRLELVTSDGTHDPPASSWTPSTSSQGCRMHIAPGAVEDAFTLTSPTRLQRTYRSGVRGVGWPTLGKLLPTSLVSAGCSVTPDGTGGVIVVGFKDPRPIALRVDSTGALHAGWNSGGLVLSSNLLADLVTVDLDALRVFPSGPDHFIAVWLTIEAPPTSLDDPRQAMAQRFSNDGALDPAWPADGAVLTPLEGLKDFTVLPDGQGGVYALWFSGDLPVGTHVDAQGQFPAGQDPSGGVVLVDAAAQVVKPDVSFPSRPLGTMVAGVRADGGLLFAWSDSRLGITPSFRVRWLEPDFSLAPGRPDAGVVLTPDGPNVRVQGLRAVHGDPQDGAFLAWEAASIDTFFQGHGEVWMTHLGDPATTAVPPSPGISSLALAAPRPNPARGSVALDVTLASGADATLELLDVAGRTLRAERVAGAGTHTLTFDRLAELPPGLYFARLRRGDDTRAVRLVLAR